MLWQKLSAVLWCHCSLAGKIHQWPLPEGSSLWYCSFPNATKQSTCLGAQICSLRLLLLMLGHFVTILDGTDAANVEANRAHVEQYKAKGYVSLLDKRGKPKATTPAGHR